jgi:hypothetical protein
MKRLAVFLLIGWLPVSLATAQSGAGNVQFSAQAVQTTPEKEERNARIYVGDNRVRLEYTQREEPVVEIYDMQNARALMLIPQQSAYMERALPEGGMMNPMLPPTTSNPCAFLPDAKCRHLGNETLYGRPASKWEMTVEQDGKQLSSLHWIDAERFMPLRQLLPDGTVLEMRPVGRETLNGRATEKWEVVTTRPDDESFTSTQWYDPELRIVIREELPGDYFRELRDIRVGKQPLDLFTVPSGYRKMEMPKSDTAAPPQQGRQPGYQYPAR